MRQGHLDTLDDTGMAAKRVAMAVSLPTARRTFSRVSSQNRAHGRLTGAHETRQDKPGELLHLLLRLLAHAICGL